MWIPITCWLWFEMMKMDKPKQGNSRDGPTCFFQYFTVERFFKCFVFLTPSTRKDMGAVRILKDKD